MHLWFLGVFSSSPCLHFPDGVGASLLWSPNMVTVTWGELHLRSAYVCTCFLTRQNRLRAFISSYTTFLKKPHEPKKTHHYFYGWQPNYTQFKRESNVCLSKRFTLHKAFVLCQINTWRMRQRGVSSPGRTGHPPSFLMTSFAEALSRSGNELTYICRVWPKPIPKLLAV